MDDAFKTFPSAAKGPIDKRNEGSRDTGVSSAFRKPSAHGTEDGAMRQGLCPRSYGQLLARGLFFYWLAAALPPLWNRRLKSLGPVSKACRMPHHTGKLPFQQKMGHIF